jgi:hypothetical protein
MTVKALMPVRTLNLVAPLPHKGTAMHITDTAASALVRSGAVTQLIGSGLRSSDVDSANKRSFQRTTPGIRTSTTANRTTTTSTTSAVAGSFADSSSPTFDQLVQAYLDCRQHKRNSSSCQAFESHLERNLCDLYEELISGSYQPGRSICFVITRPKPREVWAAEFRDRIVHHLLYNHIAPRFIAGFVAGSSACIPGRGTLYAAQRLEHGIRSITQNWSLPAFHLKMDLANFFVAIDKHVLLGQLAAKVHEPFWLELTRTVLLHDPRNNVEVRGSHALLARVPQHKSLFNAPADTGLPIGNLSSQFFANVHLNLLDQFCVHQLKAKHYVRYVDDFILLDTSAQRLNAAHDRIAEFLPERLGARLNPKKTILQPVGRGVDFVGHVIKPWRRTTRARTVRSALHELATMPSADLFASGNSYFGLLRQASHGHNDRTKVANLLLKRKHSINGDLTKTFKTKPQS